MVQLQQKLIIPMDSGKRGQIIIQYANKTNSTVLNQPSHIIAFSMLLYTDLDYF
jgi:hypothetical protein